MSRTASSRRRRRPSSKAVISVKNALAQTSHSVPVRVCFFHIDAPTDQAYSCQKQSKYIDQRKYGNDDEEQTNAAAGGRGARVQPLLHGASGLAARALSGHRLFSQRRTHTLRAVAESLVHRE